MSLLDNEHCTTFGGSSPGFKLLCQDNVDLFQYIYIYNVDFFSVKLPHLNCLINQHYELNSYSPL